MSTTKICHSETVEAWGTDIVGVPRQCDLKNRTIKYSL